MDKAILKTKCFNNFEIEKIKSISFLDSKNKNPEDFLTENCGLTNIVDVTYKDNAENRVLIGFNDNETEFVVAAQGDIYLNDSLDGGGYCLFSDMCKIENLNLENLNTSICKDMNYMFESCGAYNLKSLDLGNKFDTSNVRYMNWMFYDCGYKSMKSLKLGCNFDTKNVINMEYMFCGCGYDKLKSLNLEDKFDTSKAIKMHSAFCDCGPALRNTLNIGNKFYIKNTNLRNVFNGGDLFIAKIDKDGLVENINYPDKIISNDLDEKLANISSKNIANIDNNRMPELDK